MKRIVLAVIAVLLAAAPTAGPATAQPDAPGTAPNHGHEGQHYGDEDDWYRMVELPDGDLLTLSSQGPDGHVPVSDDTVARALALYDPPTVFDQVVGLAVHAAATTSQPGFVITYKTTGGSSIPPAEVRAVIDRTITEFLRPFDLNPNIPIQLSISWQPLPGNLAGEGGGTVAMGNDGRYYPRAVLEQRGERVPSSTPNHLINLNKNFNWHTDPAPPSGFQFDLAETVFHELSHSFNFMTLHENQYGYENYRHQGPNTVLFDIGGGYLYQMAQTPNGNADLSHFNASYRYPTPGHLMSATGSQVSYTRRLDAPVIGVLAKVGWPVTVGYTTPTHIKTVRTGNNATVTWNPGLDQFAVPAHSYTVTLRLNGAAHSTRTIAAAHTSIVFSDVPAGSLTATVVSGGPQPGGNSGNPPTPQPQPPAPAPDRNQQLDDEIVRLFSAFFARPPDPGGLAHWVGVRARPTPLAAIADEFAVSPEFINTYGSLSNTQFVQLVYRNVLDRPADTAGLNHWVGVLNRGGSRGTVMTGFSESAEYILRTGTTP